MVNRYKVIFIVILIFFSDIDDIIAMENLKYNGTLVPGHMSEIVSPALVYMKNRHVNIGDKVRQGQILFELTSPEIQAKCLQIEMDVLEQEQQVEKLKHWENSPEMRRVRTSLQRARWQMTHAQTRFEKTKKLYQAGILSKEEFLSDERAEQESRLNFQSALQYYNEMQEKGDKQYYALAVLKLEKLKEQQAVLIQKSQGLIVTSPIAGMVLAPLRQQESLDHWGLSGNQKVYHESQSMAVIADVDQLSILIKVDEFDIIHLQRDQPVNIALFAFPQQPFTGKIREIHALAPSKDTHQAASFDVKIQIDQIPEEIKPKVLLGMSAIIDIPLKELS